MHQACTHDLKVAAPPVLMGAHAYANVQACVRPSYILLRLCAATQCLGSTAESQDQSKRATTRINYARARAQRKVQPQPGRLHMLEAVTGLQIVPATS
jgi:hypothetical protein